MTLEDFYRQVLEHLQVVDADTPADASDTLKIAAKYSGAYEILLTKGLTAWSKTGDVPDYAVDPLCWFVGAFAAKDFGVVPDWNEAALGEKMLRETLARKYVSNPAQSEYF